MAKMIIGYGLKLKGADKLLLVEKSVVDQPYASVDVVHKLIESYGSGYDYLDAQDSLYVLNNKDDALQIVNSTEVEKDYNADYKNPIVNQEWIGNLEVVEISAERI